MTTIHEQLKEQRSRRIDNYNTSYASKKQELDEMANRHRDEMHWYEDFQYQVPRLVEACKKAKLEIVNIVAIPTKQIMIDANPKGFQKMKEDNYSKQHANRRKERAKKIQNDIASIFTCHFVHCNEFSLEGNGLISIEIIL